MKRVAFLKKLSFVVILSFLFIFIGCHKTPDCEFYNLGDITFHDDGPTWVWDGCYIEVDWPDGSYTSTLFYGTKSYYNKPAGVIDLYMEWEDDEYYYWSEGYVTLYECLHTDAYCTWSEKKSAEINSEFRVERKGQISKKEISSIEEFRKTIK
jgi:hypothetical protein